MTAAHGEALAAEIARHDQLRQRVTDLLDLWRRRAAEAALDSDWFPPAQRSQARYDANAITTCIADLTAALRGDTHDHPGLPGQRSAT